MSKKIRYTHPMLGKSGFSHAHPDSTKKELHDKTVWASWLRFEPLSIVPNVDELRSHIEHLIEQRGNPDDEFHVTESNDSLTYSFGEKNLAISIARHVEDAFKHVHPEVIMHNPRENEFYRITVRFHGVRML